MGQTKQGNTAPFERPEISDEEAARIGLKIMLDSKAAEKMPAKKPGPGRLPPLPRLPDFSGYRFDVEPAAPSYPMLVFILICGTVLAYCAVLFRI
jgi:hypothetical protein